MERAAVIAHAGYLTDGIAAHAQVVFPAESHAEADGTVVHPDGRMQRLRQAIARQGATRPGWWVMQELGRRLGVDLGLLAAPMASRKLYDAVAFYAGLTLDEIGGRGVRWQEREAAAAWPQPGATPQRAVTPPAAGPEANGRLRLGTFRSIWAGPEVAASPALKFVSRRAHVELSPADARRLELFDGDKVVLGSDGATIEATVALRAAVPAGSAFVEGNRVEGPLVDIRKAYTGEPDLVLEAPHAPSYPEDLEPVPPDHIVEDRFPTPEDVRREST
jgi:NADH-quinone oxidoreductase subunit G